MPRPSPVGLDATLLCWCDATPPPRALALEAIAAAACLLLLLLLILRLRLRLRLYHWPSSAERPRASRWRPTAAATVDTQLRPPIVRAVARCRCRRALNGQSRTSAPPRGCSLWLSSHSCSSRHPPSPVHQSGALTAGPAHRSRNHVPDAQQPRLVESVSITSHSTCQGAHASSAAATSTQHSHWRLSLLHQTLPAWS